MPLIKYAVLVNPLVYVSEGMRGALTPGLPHMPWELVVIALIAISAILWTAGIRTFERRAVS